MCGLGIILITLISQKKHILKIDEGSNNSVLSFSEHYTLNRQVYWVTGP